MSNRGFFARFFCFFAKILPGRKQSGSYFVIVYLSASLAAKRSRRGGVCFIKRFFTRRAHSAKRLFCAGSQGKESVFPKTPKTETPFCPNARQPRKKGGKRPGTGPEFGAGRRPARSKAKTMAGPQPCFAYPYFEGGF
jgi:hypothetical protein